MSFFRIFTNSKDADKRIETIKKQGGSPSILCGKDHKGRSITIVQNGGKINISPTPKQQK